MLINLRNALMAGKRLPYDAEVEFLESTGTQWIDTGYVPTSTSGAQVVGEFISLPTSDYSGFFGCKTTGVSDRFWAVSSNQNNGTLVGFGNNYMMASASLNTIYTTQVNYKNSRTATFTSTTNVSGFNNGGTKPVFLFAVNISAQAYYQGSMRIYSAQLTESSEIVRDFVPVRKGTVGYLYDRVSGKLFGNAGTGDFVLGQDVVPVEYIESHGTEYIDTGVIGNSSTKLELKAQGTNTSVYQTLCGGRDSNGLYGFSVWQRSTLGGAYGVRWDYLSTNASSGSGYILDGIWNTSQPNLVVKDGANNYLNGVQLGANESNTFSCNFPLALFAMNTGGSKGNFFAGKMFMCKISNNNTPTRNYTPVRVGTDATSWEGAMMDVLTRRIYRNAGTGAFTYGNDLKYPIPAS